MPPTLYCMVHGARCMVHGAWCMVRGALCTVHSAWCMVHGAVHSSDFSASGKNGCVLKDQLKDLIGWELIDWPLINTSLALINTCLHQIKETPMTVENQMGWKGANGSPSQFCNQKISVCGPICVWWFPLLLSSNRWSFKVTKWQMLLAGWLLAYITITFKT